MPRRREQELLKRDAKRNIGEELLQAIRDVKVGKRGAKYKVQANDVVTARIEEWTLTNSVRCSGDLA
jgi:hypothetical protein